MGDDADRPVPGARRICRVVAELHQRGAHRRDRRAGQDGRRHSRAARRRALRAGPGSPHRRKGVLALRGLPRRRTARPHHQANRGARGHDPHDRQRQGDDQSVGRALVEAVRQRHGQRRRGRHRHVRQRLEPGREDPPPQHPARRRGGARRAGARLSARAHSHARARNHRPRRRGRPRGARRGRIRRSSPPCSRTPAANWPGPRWVRICSRAGAPRSTSSMV